MIGKKVRGFRHLIRMAKTSGEISFFFKINNTQIGYGTALFISSDDRTNPYMPSNSDYIVFFNYFTSNVRFNLAHYMSSKKRDRINELYGKYQHAMVIPADRHNYREESYMFTNKILVPEDFEKKYAEFCEVNKKQMSNALRYAGINDASLMYFFAISNGSKNFFFWAVNAYFKTGASIFQIENILCWNEKYSQLVKNLKKGTITAYTNINDFFAVVREMSKLRRDKRANDVINMFNTAQKKILKGMKMSKRDYETLSKFGKLSTKKKINFIKKVSTIEDPEEIMKQMSLLADVHFEWKKESLLNFIEHSDNFNCEIVIDKGDIVLLKVKDYETIKRLAKTTNWCISKDKKYWNEYVESKSSATQYVLMDFSRKEDDKLSIIGFTTVHDRGITNAHDFNNTNIMGSKMRKNVSEIKSFLSKFVDCNNIYGVLDKYGINMSDIVSYAPSRYDWNRESMFDYLNQCVEDEDYYIVADYGDKVAFIAEGEKIKYFLGETYIEQRDRIVPDGYVEHIIFADFTKDKKDHEKLVFGIITHNYDTHESFCNRLYNENFEPIAKSFDSEIEEFGLPYDIICRKDDSVERFYNSIQYMELGALKQLIKDKDVISSLKSKERNMLIKDYLYNVTFTYNSSDYLNLFYENDFTLAEVIGDKYAGEFAKRIINILYDNAVARFGNTPHVPSEKEIELFNNDALMEYNNAFYVGYYIMLMKIMDKEKSSIVFSKIASFIHEKHSVCDLFDLINTKIVDRSDENTMSDSLRYVISYAYTFGSPRVMSAICFKRKTCKNIASQTKSLSDKTIETTEMWVKKNGVVYEVENVENIAAHAPRRR